MFRFAVAPYRFSIARCRSGRRLCCHSGALPDMPHPPHRPAAPELRVFDPSLIDKTVDPCENFYRYSCNGWFKRNPLPADQTSYGRFTELYELNRLHLRADSRRGRRASSATRSANEQKIGDEYASCMDTAAVEQAGPRAASAGAGPHCRAADLRRSCPRCWRTCTPSA